MIKKKRKSMRTTFLITGIVLIMITALAFVIQILAIRSTIVSNTQRILQAAHNQTAENISNYLENVDKTAQSMCNSPSVTKFLKEKDASKKIECFKDVQAVFSNLNSMDNDFLGYAIYDNTTGFVTANAVTHTAIIASDFIEPVSKTEFSTTMPDNRYFRISVPYYTITLPVLTYVSGQSNEPTGYIVFTMNSNFLRRQLDAANVQASSKTTLFDEKNEVIAGYQIEFAPLEKARTSRYIPDQSTYLPLSGWSLHTYFEPNLWDNDMRSLWTTTIINSIIILGCFIFLFYQMLQHMLNPVDKISRFMQEISTRQENALSVREFESEPEIFYHELETMKDSMNYMLLSLSEKTDQLLEKEKQFYSAVVESKRLEILAYRNQINPHFLYNTLECVRGMAISYNAPEIIEISEALSSMFRYAVKGSDFVSISEELIHLNEYAKIIHHRFMGKITIHENISRQAGDAVVPRLILQPLVENAVFHGLESKLGAGRIDVDVSLDKDILSIQVMDNGNGIQPDMLLALQKQIDEQYRLTGSGEGSAQSSIGIGNIAHRLWLYYGYDSSFQLGSIPEQGTTVTICINTSEVLKIPDRIHTDIKKK